MKKRVKKFVPKFILKQIGFIKMGNLKRKILHFLEKNPTAFEQEDVSEIMAFVKENGVSMIPYFYTKNYKAPQHIIERDTNNGLPFVLHDGKRLYFKKKWTDEYCQIYYNGLLIEQNLLSPHRYESENFFVEEGDIVADCGAAEGIFSLSIIDKASHIDLFESDKDWIEPLKATFKPYSHKINIVEKKITDVANKQDEISLDVFYAVNKVNFIKADIEGFELKLLAGGGGDYYKNRII